MIGQVSELKNRQNLIFVKDSLDVDHSTIFLALEACLSMSDQQASKDNRI